MMEGFRRRFAERLEREFGEAQVLQSTDGPVYRWVLRDAIGQSIRLTVDSPEFPHLAHLLVSDSAAIHPLSSNVIRTEDELERVIGRVKSRLAASLSGEPP